MTRFWMGLAVLFAALAVGSIASKEPGAPIGVGDLAVTALLAFLAWGCWKARR
ncbi:hypothetical protein ACIQVO_00795 [Streptomyces sp. NPDC101062]|uniref:hypothetical protein n=1 Tax=unclassified Streptomyces TaxID=2593676 RepID=UPI002E75B3F1|nr:hypothetical protein [Streptomyces sp. JV176]MEE1799613.1 hypothetical protein [Streptomyces sp. JV176]